MYLNVKYQKRGKYSGIREEEHLRLYNSKLAIHHIDYNKENNIITNLITLCHCCNGKTNFKRKYWKDHFKNLMRGV